MMEWSNNLIINNAKKSLLNWEKGYDVSSADAITLEKFSIYCSLSLKPTKSRYDTSIIKEIIKKDVVFLDKHQILISDKSYSLSELESHDIRSLVREEKNIKLIKSIDPELNIISFLEKFSYKDYERELTFLITNHFDNLIYSLKLEQEVDIDFINQIYSTTPNSLDQIKFVFFIMAKNEKLKSTPLFKVLYKYLSSLNLEDLYFFIRQN